jgi:SPRY domain
MIGFAPSNAFDVNKFGSCGWHLFMKDGTLFSQNGDNNKAYCSECKVGDTITCIYNASTSEISYERNGVSLGVAHTNVNGEDIAPVVWLLYVGDSFTVLSID